MTHSAGWIGRSPVIARVSNAEAERWEDTDWEQIVLLYDMLLRLGPSPVTRLGELRDEGHHNLTMRL
jgi:predicted RNA polymerase sigma factor